MVWIDQLERAESNSASGVDGGHRSPYSDSLSFGRVRLARARLSSPGKQDHGSHGAAGRPDDVHDHGVRGRGQPADTIRNGHARRRRAFRHVHFGGAGHAGDGTLGELSDCARARHVAERLFHLLDRDRPRRAVADGAGSRLSFRHAFPDLDAHECPRADRQRHSRLPEARHRCGHRPLYRVRGIPEREHYRRECVHVCCFRQGFRSAR